MRTPSFELGPRPWRLGTILRFLAGNYYIIIWVILG